MIGSRVQLKKAGREYKACCPFHNEKTASFWVSPEKQFYHCFGCGAHGTVLRFLMEHDRLPFPEAVEELAGRVGLEIPREATAAAGARRVDEPLYELMARVAQFYTEALSRDARARQYVANRGLEAGALEQFSIGYAPSSWHEVLRRFGGTEAARRSLADLGLIIERDRASTREGERYYDRFRDRIMFPIRDSKGRVIAFGGRIIDQGEPKYLNSPETVLFHKGRELYALYEARRSRASLQRLLVVEGYMDAVRLHQAGIAYAIATLGTATTPEHLKRIFRLATEVVFAFDGDRAGRGAAWRALQHALPEVREGREIRFLFLPEGQDPDSLVGAEGRAAFEQRLDSALPLSDYLLRELSQQSDLTSPGGLARFSEQMRPFMAKLPDGVYRDLLLARVARTIKVSPERLEELWRSSSGPAHTPAAEPARWVAPRTRVSAGRGSLVRQAVTRLLQYPGTAVQVTPEDRAGLDGSTEPGVDLLRELLDHLQSQPARNSAQILERWAEHPSCADFEKLLQREPLVADASIAGAELRGALAKLRDLVGIRRLQALEAKDSAVGLQPEERQEYLSLTMQRGSGKARRG